MTHTTEVLFPSSVDEAVSLFGDGAGVTVVAGGTIVVPEITYGRLAPARALMLSGAGLDGIEDDGTAVVVGAGTPVARLAQLADAVPGLAACALNVADGEIRGQATVGGNLCAGQGADAPRGDLQGAFLALGATARSVGAGGERSEPLEDVPRRPGRKAAARRPLREPAAASAFAVARLPAHARVHRPRRERRPHAGRRDPARGDRARRPRPAAPVGGGGRLGARARRCRGARRRLARRRRARLGVVPLDAPCPCSSAVSSTELEEAS